MNSQTRSSIIYKKTTTHKKTKTSTNIKQETHEQLDTVHKKNKSLFLAAYSLSECTEKIRDEVEVNLTKFDYVFIIHNSKFPVEENNDIDNVLYFQQLKDRMSYRNYQCVHEMDEQSGKWWLTCKKM